jgi:DNA-binding HxlR family transcriptional regulator
MLVVFDRFYRISRNPARRHLFVTMPESLSSLGVETMIAVFGGKWRPLILLHLIPRKRHFGELLRLIPGISKKVLTEQLRELESEGIITRTVLGKVPAKVEYALSVYGSSTIPILDSMCKWGHRHAKLSPQKRRKTTSPVNIEVGSFWGEASNATV